MTTTRRAPIERIGMTVLRELVEQIVTGVHPPESTMPTETALSEEFGVSRTVIRESMKRLQEKGMVTVAQGRGTSVNPQTSWNMLDPLIIDALVANDDNLTVLDELSIVRAALEAEMAGSASQRTDAEGLERLRGALQAMAENIGNEAAFREADVHFHHVVMSLSGNALAENIARVLIGHAVGSALFTGHDPAHSFELTLAEHGRITEAIASSDAPESRAAMSEHILGSWSRRREPAKTS